MRKIQSKNSEQKFQPLIDRKVDIYYKWKLIEEFDTDFQVFDSSEIIDWSVEETNKKLEVAIFKYDVKLITEYKEKYKAKYDKEFEITYKDHFAKEEYFKNLFTEIRNQLIKDQGGICCYCQSRIININNMVLEHFLPKNDDAYPELQLKYSNFLAACKNKKFHCDESKNGLELKEISNPKSVEFDSDKIKYTKQPGKINVSKITDNEDNDPLIGKKFGCLNLNEQSLSNRRGSDYNGVILNLEKAIGKEKNWTEAKAQNVIKEKIETFQKINNSNYTEFCEIFIYFLKKKLKK